MKKIYNFITILILVLSISGCVKSKQEDKLDYTSIQHIGIESIYQYDKDEVYFYTDECQYCKNLKENILRYSESKKTIVFLKVNFSDRLSIEKLYNNSFLGVPAILVFKDNQIIRSYYGFSEILEYIKDKT